MLITSDELATRLGEPGLVVADVRWNPMPPPDGSELFELGHVPGAVYLDLDDDLSDRTDLSRGRHPLPDAGMFVEMLSIVGIGRGSFVVCVDDASGAIASRLWWMLRHWLGHEGVALLDGGLGKWRAEGRPIATGPVRPDKPIAEPLEMKVRDVVLSRERVARHLTRGGVLLDARASDRYRGETEPLDAKPGHIPGAINRPFAMNLEETDGFATFKTPAKLKQELSAFVDTSVVSSCGSGVTGCHTVLAFELAGLPAPDLYVGSYSEWSQHDDVSVGAAP